MSSIWLDLSADVMRSLLHATWQGGVLAIVVLLATRCLGDRLRASWRFALWLVVFARLAAPWVPSAPWSLYAFLPQVEPQRDATSLEATEAHVRLVDRSQRADFFGDGDAADRARRPAAVDTPAGAAAMPAGENDPAENRSDRAYNAKVCQYLSLMWLAGVAALAARMIRLNSRLARLRASWPAAADPSLCGLFERCRSEARVGRVVKLQLAREDVGPAACGVLSPVIVLPARLFNSLDESELRFVLLHELIHARRCDALIDLAAWSIACVHWFNPIAWLALAGLRRERELACDAALLDLLGTTARKDYGSVLLKAVEMLQLPAAVSAGSVAMFERRFISDSSVSSLTGRIQMIANYRPTTITARAAGGMLMILLALLGLTDAAVPPGADEAKNPAANSGNTAASTPAADEPAADEVLPPVPAERAAAEKIRALGGWYMLDADRHVIEVNMCFHYDANGERHENEKKTDEALAHVPNFPRLQRLMVCETQVSDDGLKYVGRLTNLQELFIWDGAEISDKGVAHLRALPKLKFLLLGGSAITDEAVSHLSHVSSLETLLLDSNGLTDKALEYASRLPQLGELEVGNWAPQARQATITAAGLAHVRKMPALKQLGIPLIPTAVDDLKQLHGLNGLELLTIEDVLFQGTMKDVAIFELQKATPQLKVVADRKTFPSLVRVAAGADPQQQEIYRRQGADGLKLIERFLELMWAKRDAEAAQLGELSDEIPELKRFRREPGFVPFKVTMAYADSENVLAITEPPVTYKTYRLDDDGQRHEIGKRTAHVIVKAVRTKGTWRIRNSYRYDLEPGSDALLKWFKNFLTEYPGAQALRPTPPQ